MGGPHVCNSHIGCSARSPWLSLGSVGSWQGCDTSALCTAYWDKRELQNPRVRKSTQLPPGHGLLVTWTGCCQNSVSLGFFICKCGNKTCIIAVLCQKLPAHGVSPQKSHSPTSFFLCFYHPSAIGARNLVLIVVALRWEKAPHKIIHAWVWLTTGVPNQRKFSFSGTNSRGTML